MILWAILAKWPKFCPFTVVRKTSNSKNMDELKIIYKASDLDISGCFVK